jgi:hypothetical protein
MPLPSSGQLSIADIAIVGGGNSVGIIPSFSLYQLNVLAGLEFNLGSKISNFYGYPGYGYKYGNPDVLHDLGLSSRYPNDTSVIPDTSGITLRNGTFVTGTGTGSAINIVGYTTSFPGNLATQTSNQRAIRLDSTTKYGGNTNFTWGAWFKVSSFVTNFNGIIACEGRTGSTPIGHSLYITNVGGYSIVYQRWNGTTGTSSSVSIPFNGPGFAFDTWYFVQFSYSSSNLMSLYLKSANGAVTNGTQGFFPSSSVAIDFAWANFVGLRYNNWLDGNFGYVYTYPSYFNSGFEFNTIWDRTQKRYI